MVRKFGRGDRMKGLGGASGLRGYSETEVGLRDRGEEGGSFGAIKAAEEAVVSGEAARWASAAVGLFRGAGTFMVVGLGVWGDG